MKNYLLFLLPFFMWQMGTAQSVLSGETEVSYPTSFVVTPALRDIPASTIDENQSLNERKEMKDRNLRVPFSEKTNPDAEPKGDDPATQKMMGTNSLGAPLVSWTAQSGSGTPPDPTGAAGPNHYIQAVNSAYRVYTKTGTGAAGPYNLSALLTSNAGDPIVMYDKFASRWVICSFDDYPSEDFFMAVSTTDDPTGTYNLYTFTATAFPDYLKFSIWTDGYYMTANFGTSERLYVMERDVMIAGGSNPRMLSASYSPANAGYFFCPLAGFADGQLPAAGTPCPIFSFEDDGWGAAYDDAINIYNANVNWSTPSLSVTVKQSLLADPFDASYNASWNDISQPGTTAKLDGIGGVFTFRAQHRVWTGYNSVVLNMGVKVNSTTRAIRWFELHQDQSTGDWSIYQQSTYSPDANSRWCGSIAMDDYGGIGLCYAKSSTSVSPSICYTARNGYDPINQMTYAEETAAAGSGAQTFTNRFGDYSHTSLDPSDGTVFWHTGEYLTSGSQKTKVFSFRIPYNASVAEYGNANVSASFDGSRILVIASGLPVDDALNVDLFDAQGRLLSSQQIAANNGNLNTEFATRDLIAGIYLVRVGKPYSTFQRVIKVSVQ